MSTRVVVDDDEQQIADMLKQVRRLRSRLASVTPRGGHDTFTAAATPATTYQLSVIPILGTCLMALNGHVQREGTDYTVDYSVGLVTVSATQASGDKVVFRYLITDWLVARSLEPDVGGWSDNFNRTDSAVTINPASDGSTWSTSDGLDGAGKFGVSSNRGYLAAIGSGSGTGLTLGRVANLYWVALQDLGTSAGTITVDWYRTSTGSPFGCICIAQDLGSVTSITGDGFQLTLDGSTTITLRGVHANANTSHVVGTWTVAAWTTGGTTLKVTFDGIDTFELFQNGASKGTLVDTVGGLVLGTWAGWGTQNTGKDTVDNFTARPG